ncbi:MAG: hypothetical protein Q4G14_09580 [Paracoccus sp. (in: a-proteobacteria)]|uniref:hypothetical protein n=1 Tax=Paracoccus sp. TaxID=267 RepID=UPI0026E05452|nr:hypothetical protein [Paracoccus sp. (in: a-proteobacteria)]MDO5613475.1 hypothetical protein [Paracoccus sp. (in: a-proteobacteria)]
MRKIFLLASGVSLALVAGCTQNIRPTDADRAIIGAAGGYTVQTVRGKGGSDRVKGAAIGAVAGALCDDVRLCQ